MLEEMNTPFLKPLRGFSLIELMITVSVLAILLGLGLPQFSQLIATQRQRTAASELFDSLAFARSEAVKRNADVTVSADDLAGGWSVVLDDDTVLRSQPASPGVGFNPTALAAVFNPQGRLKSGASSVEVTSSGASACRLVTIASNGRPHVTIYSDECP
jgi:type IV fimbrial biogenesis protein FimT